MTIAPEAADPEDVEMLGDLVLAAVNEALRAAQELAAERMGGATGGLDLGALGGARAAGSVEPWWAPFAAAHDPTAHALATRRVIGPARA